MSELKFEIVKHIATLSEGSWSMELNKVSWNGREPKYDLRKWSADYSRMGKGVTLTDEEFEALREAINEL